MARVRIASEVYATFRVLPLTIQERLHGIIERLERWPQVSGAKPLRGELRGHWRIRTGDFRVLFRVVGSDVWIIRVEHRKDVYED